MPDGALMEFVGEGTRFSDDAIANAAGQIGCDEAVIRAVIDVESQGGFLKDNRPKILFERHYFCRLTKGQHDSDPSRISSKKTGGYKGGSQEYDRLAAAMRLDRLAALQSASWGAFQIVGANKLAGYEDVETFCSDMCRSEDKQLEAFVRFVEATDLDHELRRRDWAGFARGYKGPGYRKFRYDEKLAAAYQYHLNHQSRDEAGSMPRVLRMGDEGENVEALQRALGTEADGDFGPATKNAVMGRQSAAGMTADGIVGPKTRAALGL